MTKHKPIPLPPVIGEEWDNLLRKHSGDFDDALEQVINHENSDDLLDWWWDHKEVYQSPSLILADVFRYGWRPQERRYLLPMAGTKMGRGMIRYAYCESQDYWDTIWRTEDWPSLDYIEIRDLLVTDSQLAHAPAWVKAIEREEVDL